MICLDVKKSSTMEDLIAQDKATYAAEFGNHTINIADSGHRRR